MESAAQVSGIAFHIDITDYNSIIQLLSRAEQKTSLSRTGFINDRTVFISSITVLLLASSIRHRSIFSENLLTL